MASYSVAQAKNELPKLINRALDGERVVITRRGIPVVTLNSAEMDRTSAGDAAFENMRRFCDSLTPTGLTSVQLLNDMYEEDV